MTTRLKPRVPAHTSGVAGGADQYSVVKDLLKLRFGQRNYAARGLAGMIGAGDSLVLQNGPDSRAGGGGALQ